jgi:hypothetical protein
MVRKMIFVMVVLCSMVDVCLGQKQDNDTTGLKAVKFYYPGGQIKVEGWTREGKKEGTSKTYFENGQQKTENHWRNNVQVGTTQTWFSNGKLDHSGQMENGHESGDWKYYDDLGGKFIYQVNYKNGVVAGYKFSADKYIWRKIALNQSGISFEFPAHLTDSLNQGNGIAAYWTMYPWMNKQEIEFYSVSIFPLPSNMEEFNAALSSANKETFKDKIAALLGTGGNAMTPDINSDEWEIAFTKDIEVDKRKAKEIEIYFPKLKVRFHSLAIFGKSRLFFISGYFNEKVPAAISTRFFSSVKFDNE